MQGDREISSYEIRPDRVLVYLWSVEFTRIELKFRPRLGFVGMTAPSSVWEYYDPDARKERPPVAFRVR